MTSAGGAVSRVAIRLYSVTWFCCDVCFAVYAWTHWGHGWGIAMFFGWPFWIVYHFIVLRVMP